MRFFSLKEDTLHVWAFDWTAVPENLRGQMLSFLLPEEQKRMEGYKVADDRQRFCMGRAMLRHLSGRYLGQDGRALRMGFGDRGKPYWLEPCGDLRFSVSHSGSWVMIAFSVQREVGVDVQLMDRRPGFDGMKIARYAFHPDEMSFLDVCAEDLRQQKFHEIWTCKEALIKAAGEGIHSTPESFSVVPLPEEGQWTHVKGWQLRALEADAGYRAALAVGGRTENLILERYGMSDAGWGTP